MHIKPGDTVLHISFEDEAYPRANVFCGNFTKRQIGDKPFRPLDINSKVLPFKDKQFDVVYCSHTLQQVENPIEILQEIRRISKSAHLKEYSEFAEILFGWPTHKWVLDIEDNNLVIKKKNPERYSKFGPLFHRLYAEDEDCHRIMVQSESIMKIAFDWYETDDLLVVSDNIDIVEEEKVKEIEKDSEEKDSEELKEEVIEVVGKPKEESSLIKELKNKVAVFRPTQTDYFDYDRFEIGKVEKLLDII